MKFTKKNILFLGVFIIAVYTVIHYFDNISSCISLFIGATLPIFFGLGIAYIINILMSFYERIYFKNSDKKIVKKTKRPVCLLGAFLTLIAITALIVGLIVPQLIACGKIIASKIPGAITFIAEKLNGISFVPESVVTALETIDWNSKINDIANMLGTGVGNVMDFVIKAVTTLFSGIFTFVLALIFAVYLLFSKDKIKNQVLSCLDHFLKPKFYEKLMYTLKVFDKSFHQYIVGQCTEACILGLLCTLGMFLLKLPYAPMIGALTAFTALIPIAGAYIGGGIGAFMILTVDPIKALIFIIFLIVLQQIEGNFIYPKVVGSSMGLPGIWVLGAVTIGGGVMGIFGMLLGVPIAAAIYRLIANEVRGGTDSFSPERKTKEI